MRYEWATDQTAVTVRGELDARQVADMTAAGIALAVVRGYRCTRGTEWHWGEHTEAEIAALAADGWTCEAGESWPFEAPTPPTEAEQLAAQAAALWALPDVPETVAAVLGRVQAVAALGVDISDWSFQGVTAAAEAAMATGGNALAILAASVALRTAWDRLVYHAGDMRTADRLWPYLYDIAMKP
jgi:hypothetical protein